MWFQNHYLGTCEYHFHHFLVYFQGLKCGEGADVVSCRAEWTVIMFGERVVYNSYRIIRLRTVRRIPSAIVRTYGKKCTSANGLSYVFTCGFSDLYLASVRLPIVVGKDLSFSVLCGHFLRQLIVLCSHC